MSGTMASRASNKSGAGDKGTKASGTKGTRASEKLEQAAGGKKPVHGPPIARDK